MKGLGHLSLFFTAAVFDGISYDRLPVVVREASMQIEWLPTEYLIHGAVIRGQSRSPLTWKAHGHMMVPFLNFMVGYGFDWLRPSEEQLAHYRNTLERSGVGRERIHRIMSYICGFYEWGRARGYTDARITYKRSNYTREGLLKHLDDTVVSARPILVPRVPKRRDFPRFFNIEEQQLIFKGLSERDSLIYAWALHTGAREYEICSLRLRDLPEQSAYRARKRFAIRILGKGHKLGDLYTPIWLINQTYRYARFFGRRQVGTRARGRGKQIDDHVFLARWGTPLKPDSVYRNFRKILSAAGLDGTFHDLRHTYAICTLDALMKAHRHAGGDGRNALLELKHRMRHESIVTTEIYLRAREFYLDDVEAGLWEPA